MTTELEKAKARFANAVEQRAGNNYWQATKQLWSKLWDPEKKVWRLQAVEQLASEGKSPYVKE